MEESAKDSNAVVHAVDENLNGGGMMDTIDLEEGPRHERSKSKLSSLIELREQFVLSWRFTFKVKIAVDDTLSSKVERLYSKSARENQKFLDKTIIDDVKGQINPGELVAIMGPSGAGKTTFLNCVSLRNKKFDGFVNVNGKPINESILLNTGFVQQEDLMIATLTVYEHLRFQALLRMEREVPLEEKEKRVEFLIKDLGLSKCRDGFIGGGFTAIKGISGGEKKRVAFATEILSNPSLLFADEPTSGLDAFMAETVVEKLRDIADTGRSVICTIHQPASQVFAMFSHVLLMAEGRIAYLGPLSGAEKLFTSAGFQCPRNFNPADFYLKKLATEPNNVEESEKRIAKIVEAYRQSTEYAYFQQILSKSEGKTTDTEHLSTTRSFHASWMTQFSALTKRSMKVLARDPVLTKARLGQTVVIALLVGLIYLNTDLREFQNTGGVIFFICINQIISTMFAVLQTFPHEKPLFLREYGAGTYRVDTYFLAKSLSDIPIQVIFPSIFLLIAYFMVGLPADFVRFIKFWLAILLASNCGLSLGYFVSAAASTTAVALAIGPVVLLPLMLFGGFFLNLSDIPVYFVWLSVFSFFAYGWGSAMISVYEDYPSGDGECNPYEGEIEIPDIDFGAPCWGNGVLNVNGINPSEYWINILILLILIIGFRVLAYLILLWKAKSIGK